MDGCGQNVWVGGGAHLQLAASILLLAQLHFLILQVSPQRTLILPQLLDGFLGSCNFNLHRRDDIVSAWAHQFMQMGCTTAT